MPSRFTHRVLDHLAHSNYKPAAPKAIARDMGISPDDRPAFDEAVDQLADAGRITITRDGVIRLPSYAEEVTGTYRSNPKGFGFVIPDQPMREGDLFIPPGNARDAVSGDKVRVKVIEQSARARQEGRSPFIGRIVEVLERGQEHFVGVLIHEKGGWFVEPDGRALRERVLIRDPHAKNAKAGDKVVIELLHYPQDNYIAEGVIVNVLGEAGRPDVETQAVIAAHGLRTAFPELVVGQARDATRRFDAEVADGTRAREDLTSEFIFTIDPPDAKDFDDAISISRDRAGGQWTLGVHIADVSHFVRMNSAMDEEAKARGNSVYLPRLVLPMLPEALSNGVCSLQEGVSRFTKSAFITFDDKGHVLGQRLASTLIKSRKRLTYLEAQALIDGDERIARQHARTDTPYSRELLDTLKLCDTLAHVLQERRRRDGMIVLNLPEVDLVFDEHGHVIDAKPEDDSFTHKLIEMFMVEANEAVARTFSGLNVPVLRRIHPEPVRGDIEELQMYALAAHQRVPEYPTRHDLQRLLEATHNTPASRAIHFAVLRTLTKATYSPSMIGHFALASDHYAHFTSPIRRYPDLTLHRVIEAYLDATDNGRKVKSGKKDGKTKGRSLTARLRDDDRVLDEAQLLVLGRHCSDMEREAEQAERELRMFLVLQFLKEHHMGGQFPGVVTGVTPAGGMFVSIEPYLAEGMVKAADMPGISGVTPGGGGGGKPERWMVNECTGRLVAKRSGASVGVGDIVTVQIVQIDLASRHMDLLLTKLPETAPGGGGRGGEAGRADRRRGLEKAKKVRAESRAAHQGRGKGKPPGKGKRKPARRSR